MQRRQLIGVFVAAGVAAFGITFAVGQKRHAQTVQTVHVALRQDMAAPSAVSVKVGQYVEFDSRDHQPHSLTQGRVPTADRVTHHTANGEVSSGEFKPDEGWRVKFSKPGTYDFYDELNPKIQATVVAYQSSR